MIKLGFTDEMMECLSSLKGKKLKSFEWESIEPNRFPMFAVRINTGRFAIDVTCEVRDDIPEEYEDISNFECEKKELNSIFYYGTSTKQYAINEVIRNVSVVTDEVLISGDKFCNIDVALLIQTDYSTYAISKTWFMGEVIEVNYEGKYYSEEKALKDWEGSSDEEVSLKRRIRQL